MLGDGIDILVAAAREVDDHQVVLGFLRRELRDPGERVRGLERRNDAFEPRKKLESVERLLVGSGKIFDAAGLVEPAMLGADAGVIDAGRDRMRLVYLAT